MNSVVWVLQLLIFTIVAGLVGCNRDPALPSAGVAQPARNETPKNAAEVRQVHVTAGAAVQAVLEGLQENNPDVLWNALPDSFRREVNDLLHLYAERIDPRVWSQLLQYLGKFGNVLKTNATLLADSMPENMPSWEGKFAVEYLGVLNNVLPEIAGSDVADLGKMKTADTGEVLRTTGRRVMPHFRKLCNALPDEFCKVLPDDDDLTLEILTFAILKEPGTVRAVIEDSTDDTANVTIKWSADASKTIAFVLVEGKWIPRQLRDDWPETINFLKAYLPDSAALRASDHYRITVRKTFEYFDRVVKDFEKVENVNGITALSLFDQFVMLASTLIVYSDSVSTDNEENSMPSTVPQRPK